MRKREAGFSLVEMTIVIGIIAVLIAITVKAMGWIQHAKVTATVDQVRMIQSAALAWEQQNGKTNYTGISVDVLQSAKLLKGTGGDTTTLDGDEKNKWDGTNTAAAGTTATTLVITTGNIPADSGPEIVNGLNTQYGPGVAVYDSTGKVVTVTIPEN